MIIGIIIGIITFIIVIVIIYWIYNKTKKYNKDIEHIEKKKILMSKPINNIKGNFKMELKFKISNSNLNNSEQFLSESHVNPKIKISYKEHISKQINKVLNNNNNNKENNFKYYWNKLVEYIEVNNFYHYETLALKKGSKKFSNWLKSPNKPLENIVIIIKDNNLKKNNTIAFFTNYLQTENLSSFELELRRIEFFDWSNNKENKNKITLSSEIDDGKIFYENNEYHQIFDYKLIFDDDDYLDEKDPIYLKEWNHLIKILNEKYDKNNKKDNIDNKFLLSFKDRILLLLNKDIKLLDKNGLQAFDNFNNKWLIEENNYGLFLNDKDCLTWVNDEFKRFIQKEYNWEENIKKCEIEIKKIESELNELNSQQNKIKKEIDKGIDFIEDKTDLHKEYLKGKNKANSLQYYNELTQQSNNNEIEKFQNDLQENIKERELILERFKEIKNNSQKNLEEIKILENKKRYKEQEIESHKNKEKKFINFLNEIKQKNITIIKEIKIDSDFDIKLLDDLDNFINNKINLNQLFNITLEDNDVGTRAIVRRFKDALWNLENGYYKNPLFFKAIRKPQELKITTNLEITNIILSKYNLNNKQKLAVTKAINSDSVFYLQGPPGTGKTQTISAIAECLINEGKKIVMTSSTHEAINNFFDRLNENNLTNPNILLLKYRAIANKNENNDYSEQNLFSSFKKRMINNVVGISNNNELKNNTINLFNNYKNKYGLEVPNEYKDFICKPFCKFIFNNLKELKDYEMTTFKIDHEEWKIPISYEKSITPGIELKLSKIISNSNNPEKLKDFEKLIEQSLNLINNDEIKKIDFKNNYLKQIYDIISNPHKSSKLETLLSKIKEANLNDNDDEFLKYVREKEFINVIGVTTTSRNSIEINGEDVDLYSDYQIDCLIIDEISKSSMPEIISKAILSKKCIFAGDYLQLPPQPNIITNTTLEYLASKEYLEINQQEKEYHENLKEIEQKIIKLYKKSFFSAQVKLIQSKNNENSIYEFLNESHRFGKEILEIVNLIYPDKEKLILPINSKLNQKDFNIYYNNSNKDNPVVLINLTKPSKKFQLEHDIKIDDWLNYGFDQNDDKTLDWNKNKIHKIGKAIYNQYSGYVIAQICKKLIHDNSLENLNSRIGIITLTSTQKEIVRSYVKIHLKNYLKYITINTIDNFQGREEDIIIVDFIRGLNKLEKGKLNKLNNRNLTFLNEKERINVAVSRAKYKLILVGQFEYLKELKENNIFNKYYNILKESDNSYIEWGDDCEE